MNILDLVPKHTTVTNVESPEDAAVLTDHSLVFYEFNSFIKVPTKSHRYTYDYGKGHFDGLRSALSAKNLCWNLDHDDINDDWQSWKDTFLDTVSNHIPRKKIKGRNPLPWIKGTILHLIKKRILFKEK